MKPYIRYILPTLCTSIALLSSCSTSETEPEPATVDPRPIELMANPPDGCGAEVHTRGSGAGPIETWRNTPICLVYGASTQAYTKSWDATVTIFGNVDIQTTPSYPADNAPIHIAGYYPVAGSLEAGKAVTLNNNNTLIYTGLDGSDDLMISNEVTASSQNPFSGENRLTFTHLLTQLAFAVVSPEADMFPNAIAITGITVTSVDDNHPFSTTATIDITKTPAEAITMNGEAAGSLSAFSGTYTATKDNTVIGAVLLPPCLTEEDGYSVDATVTLSDSTEIPLDRIKAPFRQNTAYTVTLTFMGATIVPTVPMVVPWVPGTGLTLAQYDVFE